MTALIIFGSAILAFVFLVCSIMINFISSIILALVETIGFVIRILGGAVGLVLIITFLRELIKNLDNFWGYMGSVMFGFVAFIILIGVIMTFGGAIVYDFAMVMIGVLLMIAVWIEAVAEYAAECSQSCFYKFIGTIKKNTEIY